MGIYFAEAILPPSGKEMDRMSMRLMILTCCICKITCYACFQSGIVLTLQPHPQQLNVGRYPRRL
ncbi:uncharacterized protein Bfra_006500 [Botrytis fragariae]|uniref:Uncharacterized protein n=1 Tax=Botrytis fragariae TaxID=1964551 RepID=A0A8H6B4J5_9HELO|nr:uncharacterized protein Bfra_006500 [Botrytis fragariae]KAF5879294.1 hypothetical protein Bfra_006500 [Botrytis fragariae]